MPSMRLSTVIDPERACAHIVDWLVDYLAQSGLKGWLVGVSGGIDSAVVSALLTRTQAPVHLLRMPIHQIAEQHERGLRHIESLESAWPQVSSSCIDLTQSFDVWKSDFEQDNGPLSLLNEANSRARLRMTTLYAAAAGRHALVVGTGNRVEDFGVGFYTKYGDGGVDLSPIADLYKSEVYALGRALGVSSEILGAVPTDGLWGDDRSDEDQLGATYDELEWAMEHVSTSATHKACASAHSERELEVLAIFGRLNEVNGHKMAPIPVCAIPAGFRTSRS